MSAEPRIALLYQAAKPPIINGVNKPMKPGGYQDSGADIAFALQQSGHHVVTPQDKPDPSVHKDWCFPDTEQGILSAIEKGATVLWANTIVFASHPLQTSSALDKYAATVKVVGQPPLLVEQYDDKYYVNSMLKKDGSLLLADSWTVDSSKAAVAAKPSYPVVGKPIRGRGSHGVRVCNNEAELVSHLDEILQESPMVMVEEFLAGQEGTVTIMPPSPSSPRYLALPTVVRFNQQDGVAPYNGTVAVSQNSRVPSDEERRARPGFEEVERQCELVAEKMKATAPMRIDVRQKCDEPQARFALFDVNMKPNMTGPGRPGRESQACLSALAAAHLGWSYADLLERIVATAQSLDKVRSCKP